MEYVLSAYFLLSRFWLYIAYEIIYKTTKIAKNDAKKKYIPIDKTV